ncbi:hypothetical protein M2145_002491 [Lachnospiraceae bacterium PF1-21]|uniref:cohesin domain-containing protein n=1 Tax=Ohessyouella blattaphilus TaxID=2949333 RepID=UPI003E1D73B6
MKRIRKILVTALLIATLCISAVIPAFAASATVIFDDPSTTVGAEFDISIHISADSSIDSYTMNLAYDAGFLRFVSGDYTTGGDGAITLNWSGSSADMTFNLKFQALQEGTTRIETTQSNGNASDGSGLAITDGWSEVTIGPGDPSLIQQEAPATTGGSLNVAVDEKQYTVTGGFSDALVPIGFVKTTTTFEGQEVEVAKQETSDEMAYYLTPIDGGDADFFMYNSADGTFSAMEYVELSNDRYIVLLKNGGAPKLPEDYGETVLEMNGKQFPTWVSADNPEFYVVYALNSAGQRAFYRYDTTDETYQRLGQVSATVSEDEDSTPEGWFGKLVNFLEDHMAIAIIGAWVIFLILFIILIVIGVKLRHRNLELDDLYDEYGIDLEDEEESNKKEKRKKTARNRQDEEDDLFQESLLSGEDGDFEDAADFAFDDFDEEDEFEEDDFEEDEFPEDDLEDLRADMNGEDSLTSQLKKKEKASRSFDTDFIDLD